MESGLVCREVFERGLNSHRFGAWWFTVTWSNGFSNLEEHRLKKIKMGGGGGGGGKVHVVGMGPAATRFGVVASGDASGEEPDRNVPRRGRGHLEIKSHVLYYLRLAPSVICYLAH